MYSSLKTISAVTIILGILNTVASIVGWLFLSSMDALTPNMLIAFSALMFTGSIAFLLIGFYLWNLYSNITDHENSNYDDIASLRRRVEALEKKQ